MPRRVALGIVLATIAGSEFRHGWGGWCWLKSQRGEGVHMGLECVFLVGCPAVVVEVPFASRIVPCRVDCPTYGVSVVLLHGPSECFSAGIRKQTARFVAA